MQADNLDPVERIGVPGSHRGLLNNDNVFELIQNWLGVSPENKKHSKTSKVMDVHFSRPVKGKNCSWYWFKSLCCTFIQSLYFDIMYYSKICFLGHGIVPTRLHCIIIQEILLWKQTNNFYITCLYFVRLNE